MPIKPCILDDNFLDKLTVSTISNGSTIDDELAILDKRRKKLEFKTPKVIDNFEDLQTELEKTEASICSLENEQSQTRVNFFQEKAACTRLESNLQVVDADLRNNKDAQKLKRMGSELGHRIL